MTWRKMGDYPSTDRVVLVCRRGGNPHMGFCDFRSDGSRDWSVYTAGNEYLWRETVSAPTEEDWK